MHVRWDGLVCVGCSLRCWRPLPGRRQWACLLSLQDAALPLPPPTWIGGCCSEYRRHQHWSWLGKLKQCLVEGLGDCQVPYIFLFPRSEKCPLLGLRSSSWQAGRSTCGRGKLSPKGYSAEASAVVGMSGGEQESRCVLRPHQPRV